MNREVLIERLLSRCIVTETGCWEYTGYRGRANYGRVWDGNRQAWECHRAAYTLFVGPIPEGYQVDHLCRNPPCFCPDHLEAVTPWVNTMRSTSFAAVNAAKTECVNGHPFNERNTYRRANGHRDCRPCINERNRQYRRRKRAA